MNEVLILEDRTLKKHIFETTYLILAAETLQLSWAKSVSTET